MSNLLRKKLKSLVKRIPLLKDIVLERDALKSELTSLRKEYNQFVPPGHFYSPIPDINQIKKDANKIFIAPSKSIPGLELNEESQLKLLEKFKKIYKEIPFKAEKSKDLLYYFENPAYSYSDAIFAHFMLRDLKPKKLIEVGSGYSSCLFLDTNKLFLNNSIDFVFIEPYPDLLKELSNEKLKIIDSKLQDVDLEVFKSLKQNDILFIDSTHVSKIDSDVNYLFFEILPILEKGVHIHFHDIFYPFEYPMQWILEGRAWNEAYMLRSFLQYNKSFKIVLMNTFLQTFQQDFFIEHMPLCLKNPGGSIWIVKV